MATYFLNRFLKQLISTSEKRVYSYVRVDQSEEVHTVHQEYLVDFVENGPTSFWSLAYSFVSIGDMESLDVTYGGKTYVLSRDAVNEGKSDQKITYYVDGKEVDRDLFTEFYYACVSVTAQERLVEIPDVPGQADLKLEYHLTDGSTKTISYYEFDQNFYTVLYDNGESAAHTNKLYVNKMMDSLEELL